MSQGVFQTLDTLSSSDKYNTWIYNSFKDHLKGTVLDIGSGLGDIVKHYSGNNIDKVILSDYSTEMIENLNNNFSKKDKFSTVQMDIQGDDFYDTLGADSIDTITCINVLEHLKYDLASLVNMHRLLKNDGKLILLVPAFQWLYGSLDTLVDHHRRYSKKSLSSVLSRSGFKVDKFKFINFLE
ncbi:MAG: class I SAM-dependent methyltransferase [Candidatus Omnitrophica bacterium]|nr:class I SAM-dependent methyltransferase [Candidatus Omnitrophota bacterium]